MKPTILSPLFQPLTSIKGVGAKVNQFFGYLCGNNRVVDLLWHFPVGVNVRPVIHHPTQNTLGTFQMSVDEYIVPRVKRLPLRIVGQSEFGSVELVFFHYYLSALTTKFSVGSKIWVSGLIENKSGHWQVIHPDFMASDMNQIPKYEVLYPLTKGVSNKLLSKIINQCFENLPTLPEWLPDNLLKSHQWSGWNQSLYGIHHPMDSINPLFRDRLVFDELLAQQLTLAVMRYRTTEQGGFLAALPAITLKLPFQLTSAQIRVLSEIDSDLSSGFMMNRLLQGDVGSGKTIVALLAGLKIIANRGQVAIMAPTDILARQHFQKMTSILRDTSIRVSLLTAQEKGLKRQQILSDLKSGQIDLIIGTHALIQENVIFHHLGLAIVDEQHRFGVEQRLTLRQKQSGCHLLVMSATPIPRTLSMTLYGDMDVSVLNEKPVGRQEVITRVLSITKISEVIQKLKNNMDQVYWVCPLVAESEQSDLMAAEKRYEMLQNEFGPSVGLIHGQMSSDEKTSVMQKFIDGQIRILVSTTVIEVGVDVPRATIMIVEQAERFGLATLHQLRGRVGRGSQQSSCVLLHGRLSQLARERLDVLRRSTDGFEIANADLQLRGGGETLGLKQSGFGVFRLAELPRDQSLLDLAHETAHEIIKTDPDLKQNPNLRILLYLFERDRAILTRKAG